MRSAARRVLPAPADAPTADRAAGESPSVGILIVFGITQLLPPAQRYPSKNARCGEFYFYPASPFPHSPTRAPKVAPASTHRSSYALCPSHAPPMPLLGPPPASPHLSPSFLSVDLASRARASRAIERSQRKLIKPQPAYSRWAKNLILSERGSPVTRWRRRPETTTRAQARPQRDQARGQRRTPRRSRTHSRLVHVPMHVHGRLA